MQGGIRYILYVLLFILTATLCGQSSAARPDRVPCPAKSICAARSACYTESSLFRQTPPPDASSAGRYEHSMIAPEIPGAVFTTNSDQKVITLHQSAAMHSTAVKSALVQTILRRSVDLHPRPVAYYVFSLGKIVI